MDNLPKRQGFDFGQVQIGMIKLNLDFQNDMILGSYENLVDSRIKHVLNLSLGLLQEFHSLVQQWFFGGSEKGVCETKCWEEDGRQGDDNLTRGRWILTDSVKSENYFENLDHKIGYIGHIESDKLNPAYMVGSYCT